MPSIPFVGKCFATAPEFSQYLSTIALTKSWRPRFIVMHHTGSPTLKNWNDWQGRVSDEQWMKNLAAYYGTAQYDSKGRLLKGAWSAGPHFFVTPKNFCVLSWPDRKGTHAAAFNSASWGVEVVGNFDVEPFDGVIRQRAIDALACMHNALGFTPEFTNRLRGLHFHRDDPGTSKTCPGTKVQREPLIVAVKQKMADMTGGDDPDDEVVVEDETKVAPIPTTGAGKTPEGTVLVAANDFLNLRAEASSRSPALAELPPGHRVAIVGEAMNVTTKWLRIWTRVPSGEAKVGWVSDQFVKRL